jgi:hypothetical protein
MTVTTTIAVIVAEMEVAALLQMGLYSQHRSVSYVMDLRLFHKFAVRLAVADDDSLAVYWLSNSNLIVVVAVAAAARGGPYHSDSCSGEPFRHSHSHVTHAVMILYCTMFPKFFWSKRVIKK